MTSIDTDNPIIQFRVWCYDLIWQYWPIWLAVSFLIILLMYQHFARRQRKWEERQKEIEAKTKEVEQLRERARSLQDNPDYFAYRTALEALTHAELDLRDLKKRNNQ